VTDRKTTSRLITAADFLYWFSSSAVCDFLPGGSNGVGAAGPLLRTLRSCKQGSTSRLTTQIMVRWWWFGPSVTKAELERER